MNNVDTEAVLILAPVKDELMEKLAAHYRVYKLFECEDTAAFLAKRGNEIKGIVTRGDIGVRNAVLDMLPGLEIIAIYGVGTDAVDLEYTRGRGIIVTTTPGVLTDDVADMAMGLLLAASRRLCQGDSFVRAGKWPHGSMPLSSKVSGKKLGIFGMGRIGQAIARRAAGFDMQITYTDRQRFDHLPYDFLPDLPSLAAANDFLIVAISGDQSSVGIINRSIFALMPAHALLINIARGTLVNQDDLIDALRDKQIGGAALDVFADEPHVPRDLIDLDIVVLQPHVASATVETRIRMSDIVYANIEAHFSGRPAPTAIS
ncbi:2-hydroxyacid dehydrogenase [Sodalis sp. dw_96]|uniref:2-hydroxyacid dehydrogenase n=1 Tax=Sodalis sp. dw_96 TaxID=2719794 RepID=UPI001BD3FB6A|nr:2-hydroxyacid dehydrogenase [Sodalis sp. dw_96]